MLPLWLALGLLASGAGLPGPIMAGGGGDEESPRRRRRRTKEDDLRSLTAIIARAMEDDTPEGVEVARIAEPLIERAKAERGPVDLASVSRALGDLKRAMEVYSLAHRARADSPTTRHDDDEEDEMIVVLLATL